MRATGTRLLMGAALCAALIPAVGASKDASPPTLTTEQWRKDLKAFARELPRRHKNLFHSMSQDQFEKALAELDAALPTLEPHQIVVRMKQITGLVGDGHTGVHLPPWFGLYPMALFWFGDDLRVLAATKPYERVLGARLVHLRGG